MNDIKGNLRIKEYYDRPEVAGEYLKKRFTMPLRQIHHERQFEFINNAINNLEPNSRILEIAMGPARLTAEIKGNRSFLSVGVDHSSEMLKVGKKNLINKEKFQNWNLVNSDGFELPFKNDVFDLIFVFRLIRHFGIQDRQRIYQEIARVLNTRSGVLIFDAQNHNISYPHRIKEGLKDYPVYDKLYRRQELIEELVSAGWKVRLYGVMCRFNLQEFIQKILLKFRLKNRAIKWVLKIFENNDDSNPSEWIVLCRQK
jgi:ubiquinone/menaquinone biosynthesis C-methylase UbiE